MDHTANTLQNSDPLISVSTFTCSHSYNIWKSLPVVIKIDYRNNIVRYSILALVLNPCGKLYLTHQIYISS